MERDPSYPTQSRSDPAVSDHSSPSFSLNFGSQLLQRWYPSQLLYGAAQYSDGEDVPPQNRTIPPLTRASDIGHQFLTYPVLGCGHPMNFSEDDQYHQSRLTRISALVPTPETYGTQDDAPHAPHAAGEVERLVASVPPNGHPLPPARAHTLNQICPVWNSQNPGVDDADALYSPHPVESNGGSSMLQFPPFKSPPHDARLIAINDTIQTDVPDWTEEYGHADSIHLGTLGGHCYTRTPRAYCDSHESQTPFPYYIIPPPEHVFTVYGPTLAYPPIAPNTADQTIMNVGTKPLPLDYTAPQPGGGDDRGWAGENYHVSGEASHSNEFWHQQPYSSQCLRPHNIRGPSVHDGSLGASHAGAGPPAGAPVACVACNHPAPEQCGWQDIGSGTCSRSVTCGDLSRHLATFHGIKDIPFDTEIECRWCSPPTTLTRKSMLRHCREVHLNHPR